MRDLFYYFIENENDFLLYKFLEDIDKDYSIFMQMTLEEVHSFFIELINKKMDNSLSRLIPFLIRKLPNKILSNLIIQMMDARLINSIREIINQDFRHILKFNEKTIATYSDFVYEIIFLNKFDLALKFAKEFQNRIKIQPASNIIQSFYLKTLLEEIPVKMESGKIEDLLFFSNVNGSLKEYEQELKLIYEFSGLKPSENVMDKVYEGFISKSQFFNNPDHWTRIILWLESWTGYSPKSLQRSKITRKIGNFSSFLG